jgi:hypothetical protein
LVRRKEIKMTIKKTKYVNATKYFPLEFDSKDNDGEDTEFLEEAFFYDSEKEAKDDLERFDEPDTRRIIPVIVTYEF